MSTQSSSRHYPVQIRVPVRVDFTGGYTDVAPFTDDFSGRAVNAAVSLYVRAKGRLREDGKIRILSHDLNTIIESDSVNNLEFDGKLDLVTNIIRMAGLTSGIDVIIDSDPPPSSGLGTSGAVGVATVGLVRTLLGRSVSRVEIAEEAAQREREIGSAGGRQDQYASALGGFHFLEYSGALAHVSPLNLLNEERVLLQDSLLLIHPGGSRKSGDLVTEIMRAYRECQGDVREHLIALNELAPQLCEALAKADLGGLSDLFNEVRFHQKALHPGITSEKIEAIFSELSKIGVRAGKGLGGAGPGACLLFVCDPLVRDGAISVLARLSCQILSFSFESGGLEAVVEPHSVSNSLSR